jgi:DNA-directed RNA polymerase specialized sigma24 family protein
MGFRCGRARRENQGKGVPAEVDGLAGGAPMSGKSNLVDRPRRCDYAHRLASCYISYTHSARAAAGVLTPRRPWPEARMLTPGSVTGLLEGLQRGDHEAARLLWQRYYPRLVALARNKLRGTPRRAADEEDAALSAFDSFCRRAEQGQFPDLKDRDGLWALLVVLTARKAADLAKHHHRDKRGGGKVRGDSGLRPAEGDFDELADDGPTPEEAALLAEEVEALLGRLRDPALRQVAVWKLEGYTNAEIADKQGCSEPTVRRRLGIIRRLLKQP